MAEKIISTREDWNDGDFDKTSADRDDESGDLGIGYVNGDFSEGSSTQPLSNLAFYYRMDDGSISGDAGTVPDFSGNARDATTEGGITTGSTGVFGTNCFDFGDAQAFYNTYRPSDDSAFTISMWLNIPMPSEYGTIFRYTDNDSGAANEGITIDRSDDGLQVRFTVQDPTSDGSETVNVDWTQYENEWVHAVMVYDDAGALELYINGGLHDSVDEVDDILVYPDNDIYIGNQPAKGHNLDGQLDEVMFFEGVALSQSEIETLYFDGQTDSEFTGTWTETVVDETSEQTWTEIDFSSHSFTIPTDDNIDVVVRSLDDGGSENDSTTLNLSEGTDTYDISDLANGHQLEVEFQMEVTQ